MPKARHEDPDADRGQEHERSPDEDRGRLPEVLSCSANPEGGHGHGSEEDEDVDAHDPSAQHLRREGLDESVAQIEYEDLRDARGIVLEGETYFWRVTAVLADGRQLVSKLAEFSIRK